MAHHPDTKARRNDQGIRRWFTPRRLIVSAFLVLLVSTFAAQRPIRGVFHHWRMKSAWDETFSPENEVNHGGLIGYSLDESWERYEFHRDKLVELGMLHFHHFRFDHLMNETDEQRHFLHRLLHKECPPNLDWRRASQSVPSPSVATQLELDVSCRPEDSEAWREFIARNDAPEYRRLIMSNSAEGANQ